MGPWGARDARRRTLERETRREKERGGRIRLLSLSPRAPGRGGAAEASKPREHPPEPSSLQEASNAEHRAPGFSRRRLSVAPQRPGEKPVRPWIQLMSLLKTIYFP